MGHDLKSLYMTAKSWVHFADEYEQLKGVNNELWQEYRTWLDVYNELAPMFEEEKS